MMCGGGWPAEKVAAQKERSKGPGGWLFRDEGEALSEAVAPDRKPERRPQQPSEGAKEP